MAAKPDAKYTIFLSHISDEAALGTVVKEWIEDQFGGQIEAFLSSDPKNHPGGDEWLKTVKDKLQDKRLVLLVSLLSPQSVSRQWISIELGAAWILDRRVFPLCHSGQTLGTLPRPLQDFRGADLAADDAAERLIGTVEQVTGLTAPRKMPKAQFLQEMRAAVHQGRPGASMMAGVGTVTAAVAPAKAASEIPHEQVSILQALARVKNRGEDDLPESDAGTETNIPPAVLTYHFRQLQKREFISTSHYSGDRHYSLAPDGAGWLLDHGLMPDTGLD